MIGGCSVRSYHFFGSKTRILTQKSSIWVTRACDPGPQHWRAAPAVQVDNWLTTSDSDVAHIGLPIRESLYTAIGLARASDETNSYVSPSARGPAPREDDADALYTGYFSLLFKSGYLNRSMMSFTKMRDT